MGTSHEDTPPEGKDLELLERELRRAMPRQHPAANFRDSLRGHLAYAARRERPAVEIARPKAPYLRLWWGLAALSIATTTFLIRRTRTAGPKGEEPLG